MGMLLSFGLSFHSGEAARGQRGCHQAERLTPRGFL